MISDYKKLELLIYYMGKNNYLFILDGFERLLSAYQQKNPEQLIIDSNKNVIVQ